MTRAPRPDFLLIGAPKAGTSALHAALAQHPGLFLSPVKEPKYYMCGDSPPPAYRGPGDAHSQPGVDLAARALPRPLRRRPRRRRCAARARRSTSTTATPGAGSPRTLPDGEAGRGAARPGRPRLLQLDAPVDGRPRAARRRRRGVRREAERVDTGWAPFWHYRGLGMYGRPARRPARARRPRERVLLLRYRDARRRAAARPSTGCAASSASAEDVVDAIPRDNSRAFVQDGLAAAAARAGDPRRARGSASSCRRRCGGGSASR